MLTIEELLNLNTPFLSIDDITEEDWQSLDFELEKYDRANQTYDLDNCKVLAFVLQQIHYDKMNFNKVPNFIRNGRQFQELVITYNPELTHILFPKTTQPKENEEITHIYEYELHRISGEIRMKEHDVKKRTTARRTRRYSYRKLRP